MSLLWEVLHRLLPTLIFSQMGWLPVTVVTVWEGKAWTGSLQTTCLLVSACGSGGSKGPWYWTAS